MITGRIPFLAKMTGRMQMFPWATRSGCPSSVFVWNGFRRALDHPIVIGTKPKMNSSI